MKSFLPGKGQKPANPLLSPPTLFAGGFSMYPMRRSDRQISREEAFAILERAEFSVLSLVDPDGEPYGVPLSFVLDQTHGALLFHAARGTGRKLDCIAAHQETDLPAHCTVVTDVRTLPEKFSTEYASVMVSGPVDLLDNTEDKMKALLLLAAKYAPDHMDRAEPHAQDFVDKVDIIRLQIKEISGKSRPQKRSS